MSMFSTGGFTAYQYHRYNPDSIALKNIGLSSYTASSLQKFGKLRNDAGTEVIQPEIAEFFNGQVPISPLLGLNPSIMFYNKENDKYELKTGSEIFSTPSGNSAGTLIGFQNAWDKYQKGEITAPIEKWKIEYTWAAINTSLSGCVTFPCTIPIIGKTETFPVRCYFVRAGKTSSDRKVATKGVPTFVVESKDAVFQSQSYYDTSNAPPGLSVPAKEGGVDNPDNTIAAKPLYRTDPVTGKIEFGTHQCMMRLLSDLDGADVPSLPKDVDATSSEEFKILNPPTAKAIPYMAHNGNPRDFQCNSYHCKEGIKQKVTVVNMTPRKYKRGDLVLCSLINGMWIPVGFDLPQTTLGKVEIVWKDIQKYIVDYHSFFRDGTLAYGGRQFFGPNQYIPNIRTKYYNDIKSSANQDLKKLEIGKISILNLDTAQNPVPVNGVISVVSNNLPSLTDLRKPNLEYRAVYDTDVLGTSFGGLASQTKLCGTNVSAVPAENNIYVKSIYTTYAFGASLVDGYKGSSVNSFKNQNGLPLTVNGANSHILTDGALNLNEPSYFLINQGNINSLIRFEDSTAFDVVNFKNFPMQMGLHSSGNGILNCQNLENTIESAFNGNSCDILSNYIVNPSGRYTWLTTGNKSSYDLQPVSPNKIQFNPLGTFTVLSGGRLAAGVENTRVDKNNKTLDLSKLDFHVRSYVTPDGSTNNSTASFPFINTRKGVVFGRLFDNKWFGMIPFGTEYYDKLNGGVGSSPLVSDGNKHPQLSGHVGINLAFPIENGMGVNGVVTMRGTFRGNTGLRFSVQNHWGYAALGGKPGNFSYEFFGNIAGAFVIPSVSIGSADTVFYGSQLSSTNLDEFGTFKIIAKVYDHCPNTIYDGRYFTPLFFTPNDSSVDFDHVIAPAVGSAIIKDTKITKQKNTGARNKLLSGGGFRYIKNVAGVNQASIRVDPKFVYNPDAPNPGGLGIGYAVGNKIYFGNTASNAAIFEITQVAENGGIVIAGLKMLDPGDYAEGAFNQPIPCRTLDGEPEVEAKLVAISGLVSEKLVVLPEPKSYGAGSDGITVITADDNNGLGVAGDGRQFSTTGATITFEESEYNTTGFYDVYLFAVSDASIYAENNTNGFDSRIDSEALSKYAIVTIDSV